MIINATYTDYENAYGDVYQVIELDDNCKKILTIDQANRLKIDLLYIAADLDLKPGNKIKIEIERK